MQISEFFPIWDQLTEAEQHTLERSATRRLAKAGTVVHNGSADCVGLILIDSGQLRAYILSEGGREITIYRLFERDVCLFSASCMLSSIQFDVSIEVEKDAELIVIPALDYQQVMNGSAALANYTNAVMASRFSEVMWLINAVLFQRFDRRLAGFLIEESTLENSDALAITQERIANHLGTAREVVTRMLRYFQSEGLVLLRRGGLEIIDRVGLETLIAAKAGD